MARHKKSCKVLRIDQVQTENVRLMAENGHLSSENARLLAENERLAHETTELNARLDESRKARPSVNNNLTINILAYGNEPLPKIGEVLQILKPPEESIARYIELKHFRNPETANLRIRNKRSGTIQIVQEDAKKRLRWTEKDKKEMIEQLVERNLDELTDTHGAERIEKWRNWYEKAGLDKNGFEKTDAWKRINNDVERMILTQSNANIVRA